jgi:curli production assembly/transport component CsgE
MIRIARRFAYHLACLLAACAIAGQASGRAPVPDGWGIVTSQPITVAGHEFCRAFITTWLDKPGSDRYTIAIRERPSARWGTQVWVEYGPRRVLQVQLPPTRTALRALGENAAESAYQAVLDAERQRTLFLDADLAADEF